MGGLNLFNRLNFPLIIGSCIILLITAVCFYPEQFATADPYGKETIQYEKATGKLLIPPVPPGEEYVWGTDEKGRDLRSLIVYGTGATMAMAFAAAFIRLLIALPLSIAAAYKNKAAALFIQLFNAIFNAFPMIMIILILTSTDLSRDMFSSPMSAAVFVMSAFGWGKLAKLLTKAVEDVLSQDFIEGEIAIGKTKLDIAIQNVIPHTIPSIVVLFFLEVAVVLLLLSQVGVLGLVLTGGLVDDGSLRVPYEFDWTSLLVFSHYLFSSSKMWIITYPAAAFALSIIGFNLLGEGIRLEFEKRDSRVITFIKRIPRYLSPLKLIYELRSFGSYRKTVCCKAGVVLAVLIIVFLPSTPSKHSYDSVTAFETIQDIGSSEFKYREYKVGRNVIAMDYLADKLSLYGIKPFDNKYIHELVAEEKHEIADAEINVNISGTDIFTLTYKKDFILAEPIAAVGMFRMVIIDKELFKNYGRIMSLKEVYKDNILLIDARHMEYMELNSIMSDIKHFLKPKGVILIEDWSSAEGRGNKAIYVNGMDDIFTILIASDKGEELLKRKSALLSVKIEVETIKQVLYANVIGVIPGKDPALKNDIIIIGSSIKSIIADMGKGNRQALSSNGIAIELELARMLGQMQEEPDRTVIFAFWDEAASFKKGAKLFSERYIDRSKNDVFYVDLGKLDNEVLLVDSSGIKPKNKKGQSYIRSLRDNIDDNDIQAAFRPISNGAIGTFLSSKQEVLAFDSANPKYVVETRKKRQTEGLTREDLIKFHNIGQMIIDTVFDIIYDKETN